MWGGNFWNMISKYVCGKCGFYEGAYGKVVGVFYWFLCFFLLGGKSIKMFSRYNLPFSIFHSIVASWVLSLVNYHLPLFTCYLSFVNCQLSLVIHHFSFVTSHLLFVICYLSLVIRYFTFVTCNMPLVICHLLHVTCYMLIVIFYLSYGTCHLQVVTCKLSLVSYITYAVVVCLNGAKALINRDNGCLARCTVRAATRPFKWALILLIFDFTKYTIILLCHYKYTYA